MSATVNPIAAHHLPGFITPPGQTDVLMVVSLVSLLVITLSIGVFYFRLHALPEQIAHKGEKIQFQFVAVLSLIALFTHNHIYWILALLIAFVRIPDVSTPLMEMASSLARIADAKLRRPAPPVQAAAASAPPRPDKLAKAATEDRAQPAEPTHKQNEPGNKGKDSGDA